MIFSLLVFDFIIIFSYHQDKCQTTKERTQDIGTLPGKNPPRGENLVTKSFFSRFRRWDDQDPYNLNQDILHPSSQSCYASKTWLPVAASLLHTCPWRDHLCNQSELLYVPTWSSTKHFVISEPFTVKTPNICLWKTLYELFVITEILHRDTRNFLYEIRASVGW